VGGIRPNNKFIKCIILIFMLFLFAKYNGIAGRNLWHSLKRIEIPTEF